MSIRITCINKSSGQHENPYTAISRLGWKDEATGENGKSTRLEMYDWINKGGKAYVKDNSGNIADLITAENLAGTKYVKTKADDVKSDNLLKLSECV